MGLAGFLNRPILAVAVVAVFAPVAEAKPRKGTKAMAQAPVTTMNWTGFYIGASGGLVRGGEMSQVPAGQFLNPINYPPAGAVQLSSSYGDQNSYGGGGQFGYLRQTDRFVWGYEVDYFTGANAHAQTNRLLTTPLSGNFRTDFNYQVTWLTTVRARGGFAFENFLLYATGGLAIGGIKPGPQSYFAVGNNLYDGTHTSTRIGWSLGAGLEYAVTDRLSIRQEYLYTDLGSETYYAATSTPGFAFESNVRHQIQMYRVGLNFKF